MSAKNRVSRAFLIARLIAFAITFSPIAKPASAQGECNENDIRRNYSLYSADYANKNYADALPYLKWILRCAPDYGTENDRNFRRLVDVYEGIGMASEDPDIRRKYLDSTLVVYDTAPTDIEAANIELDLFRWKLNKGGFIQSHAEDLEDLQTIVGDIYYDAYQIDHTRVQNYYINYIILDMVNNDRASDAIEFMDQVEEDGTEDEEILATLDRWRGQLLTSPEERIAFLESQIDKKPDDAEMKDELLQLYMEEGYRDRAYELAETIKKTNPTARLYRMLGKMLLDDGNTDEAIKMYKQSLEIENGSEAALEVHFNIGIAHQQAGRHSDARTYFQLSLRSDPGFFEALIAIGDLYVTAVLDCNSFEREDRAVYWLAADYFDRAASVAEEPTLQNLARARTNSIRQYFPSEEDKFFKNWITGNEYAINYGCYVWIAESTTVR